MPLREPSSLGLASRAWIVSGSRPRPRSREAKIGGGAIMSAHLAIPDGESLVSGIGSGVACAR